MREHFPEPRGTAQSPESFESLGCGPLTVNPKDSGLMTTRGLRALGLVPRGHGGGYYIPGYRGPGPRTGTPSRISPPFSAPEIWTPSWASWASPWPLKKALGGHEQATRAAHQVPSGPPDGPRGPEEHPSEPLRRQKIINFLLVFI